MPRQNYKFEKRQRELEKKKKKEQKRRLKLERTDSASDDPNDTPGEKEEASE